MEKAFLSSDCSKVKDHGWESGNSFKIDKDYPYGYPWPPRYYTCSFCQREFKSAQALGGHMNIHRRDRARLRAQSPNNNPILLSNTSDQNPSPNPNPNPNPNYYNPINNCSPSSSPANNNVYARQYSLVSLSLSSFPPPTKNGAEKLGVSRDFQEMGKKKDLCSSLENHHLHDHRNEHEARVFKSSSTKEEEEVKLDLELCLGEAKQDLDLELRLGI